MDGSPRSECRPPPRYPSDDMSTLIAFLVEDSPANQASLIAALEELAPIKVVGMVDDER